MEDEDLSVSPLYAALSGAGTLADWGYCFKNGKGFWAYVGYGMLGGMAGGVVASMFGPPLQPSSKKLSTSALAPGAPSLKIEFKSSEQIINIYRSIGGRWQLIKQELFVFLDTSFIKDRVVQIDKNYLLRYENKRFSLYKLPESIIIKSIAMPQLVREGQTVTL